MKLQCGNKFNKLYHRLSKIYSGEWYIGNQYFDTVSITGIYENKILRIDRITPGGYYNFTNLMTFMCFEETITYA